MLKPLICENKSFAYLHKNANLLKMSFEGILK